MWVYIAIGACVLIWLCVKYPDAMFGANRRTHQSPKQKTPVVRFNQQIVGESNYQPELRSVAGPGEVRHLCVAIVAADDRNEYDAMAVVITIEGQKVGYLSKARARKWRAHNAKKQTCEAVIVGGGQGRMLGVWLRM